MTRSRSCRAIMVATHSNKSRTRSVDSMSFGGTRWYQNCLLSRNSWAQDGIHLQRQRPSQRIGSRAASFKRPLLPVDVSGCLCVCVSATLTLNISERKAISRFVSNKDPIGKCLRRVDWWRHRWRRVTRWRYTRDFTIFKVVAFAETKTRINYRCGPFK